MLEIQARTTRWVWPSVGIFGRARWVFVKLGCWAAMNLFTSSIYHPQLIKLTFHVSPTLLANFALLLVVLLAGIDGNEFYGNKKLVMEN